MKAPKSYDAIGKAQRPKGGSIVIISIPEIPKNLEEFRAMEQMDLTIPENTALMFLVAGMLYVRDPKTGVDAINILKGPVELSAYDIQFLRDRLGDKPYLPASYFKGASPENGYTPEKPYTVEIFPDPRPQDTEEGFLYLYLKSAGADSKRPIGLRRKGNEWFLWSYGSIITGIRIPAELDPWA